MIRQCAHPIRGAFLSVKTGDIIHCSDSSLSLACASRYMVVSVEARPSYQSFTVMCLTERVSPSGYHYKIGRMLTCSLRESSSWHLAEVQPLDGA